MGMKKEVENMRKVVIAFVAACILALGLGGPVYAFVPPEPVPHPPPLSFQGDTWGYYAEDEFLHWGPAVYYEQPVLIHYEGPARVFFNTKNHYSNYRFRGTAKVYEAVEGQNGPVPGNLLDERPFSATITFRDSQNSWGWFPRVWPIPIMMGYVESFSMNWTIGGVYDYTAKCKDGHWTVELLAHTSPPVRGGAYPGDPTFELVVPEP
jgi:hypothetical protein